MGDGRWTTTVMMAMRGNSRGRKEEENTTIEGQRSREGPKDATQQPTNGGAQLEAVGVYTVMVCRWTDHILARNPLLEVEADLS